MRNLSTAAFIFALLSSHSYAGPDCLAQSEKEPGSITGIVNRDGKPAAGIKVIAIPVQSDTSRTIEQMFSPSASIKATTGPDGVYRLEGLSAGKYLVAPFASPLISSDQNATRDVTVTEGATVEDIDFALSLGGVITGRITDSEGRPVIGERISLKPLDKTDPAARGGLPIGTFGDRMYATDDRGVYRIFGLRPGRYIVGAGKDSDVMSSFISRGPKRVQTFYPSVIDETKAKPVQATAGVDAAGVDIQFTAADKGFVVSGRVVDSEKGAAIANAMVAYSKGQVSLGQDKVLVNANSADDSGMPGGFTTTNEKGEFRFSAVAPGNYKVEATSIGAFAGVGGTQFYADPVSFEVKSANVDKLDIKVHRGAVITGVVVVESTDTQDSLERFGQLMLMAMVIDPTKSDSTSNCVVGADGSFKLGGLKAGKVTIRPLSMNGQRPGLLRIERNGVEVQREFEIHPDEEVTGIRVVVALATCSIRGRVAIQGGALQPGAMIRARARLVNADPSDVSDVVGNLSVEVSSNGSFAIENLTPGSYEVEVFTIVSGQRGARTISAKQSVTVTAERPAEAELVLELGGKGSDK